MVAHAHASVLDSDFAEQMEWRGRSPGRCGRFLRTAGTAALAVPYERMDGLRRRVGVASSLLLKWRRLDRLAPV